MQESTSDALTIESPFSQLFMIHNLDYSLLTISKWKLLGRLAEKHETIIQRRAKELRFYPEYGLTDKERNTTLKCLTYEELKLANIVGVARAVIYVVSAHTPNVNLPNILIMYYL